MSDSTRRDAGATSKGERARLSTDDIAQHRSAIERYVVHLRVPIAALDALCAAAALSAEAPALPVIPRSAVLSSQRYAAVTANPDDGHTQEAELFYGRDSATEYAAEYGGMVFDCVLIDARAVTIEPEPAPQEKPE